ncbi:MAG TPA: hypothetical protein VK211_10370 [Kamptonema sp.]|nr:hypothetical protein [Kamptonema sp.]
MPSAGFAYTDGCHHHNGFACGTGLLPVNYRINAVNSKYCYTKFLKGELAKTNYFCSSRPNSFVGLCRIVNG